MSMLSQVFHCLTEHARAPAQCRGGRLAVLRKKKGCSSICCNSSRILFGDHCGDLWNALLASYVSRRVDSYLPKEQCGCLRGKGTLRASHLSKAFLSRCSRLGEPAGMLFLDLSKPFDKVVRETLIEMRSGEINIEVGLGLTQAAARHMATTISESGGLLRELGVPDLTCVTVRGFITHPLVAPSSRAKERARAASSVPCCLVCSTAVCCVSFARRLPLLVHSLLSPTDMVLTRCRLSVMSAKIASVASGDDELIERAGKVIDIVSHVFCRNATELCSEPGNESS